MRNVTGNLVSSLFAAALIFLPLSASAGILFESDASTGASSRSAGSGILTRFEFASAFTLTQIAVEMDLSGDGNVTFFIFDSITGDLFYQSAATAFVDDGTTFKLSDPFSFEVDAATRYAIGASADVANTQPFVVPGGKAEGDVSSLGLNQNVRSGGVFDGGLNGTDGRIRLYGDVLDSTPVPTPWTLTLLAIGFLGFGLRRKG